MPTPNGDTSPIDIAARQALSLHAQALAAEAVLKALIDQTATLLETVRVLQQGEAQRNAALTARAGAEEEKSNLPPVFGRPATDAGAGHTVEAPPLPRVPLGIPRT